MVASDSNQSRLRVVPIASHLCAPMAAPALHKAALMGENHAAAHFTAFVGARPAGTMSFFHHSAVRCSFSQHNDSCLHRARHAHQVACLRISVSQIFLPLLLKSSTPVLSIRAPPCS